MLFATLSVFALGVAAASSACTSTTKLPAGCCPPNAGHTSTISVDCHGCSALVTQRTGPVCDIACPTPRPTAATATTTVAVCKTSPKPSCTITAVQQIPFGCTITQPATTVTAFSDCSGCDLVTKTTNRFGVGPECVSGRKTVTSGITTVTDCAASKAY